MGTGLSLAKYLPGKLSVKTTIPLLKHKQILHSALLEMTTNCIFMQRKCLEFQAQP